MAQLLVRNLETAVVRKLRQKAAAEGISMEEEHRRILREALLGKKPRPEVSFKEWLCSAPFEFTEKELRRNPGKWRKVDL